MNWSRGLWRLWMVATICWIAVTAWADSREPEIGATIIWAPPVVVAALLGLLIWAGRGLRSE